MRIAINSTLLLISVLMVLVITVQAAPTITANPNPITIPNGQTSANTTITWQAAPDYTYCEVYLSVDNAEWTEFGRGRDGAKLVSIKLGSSYTFRMMVYEGQAGTPKVITTLNVAAVKGNSAPPASGPGGYDRGAPATQVESNRSGSISDVILSVSPLIENVKVEPGGRQIVIRFNGPPNAVPYVAIGRAAPLKKGNEWIFGDQLVGGGFVGPGMVSSEQKARGDYVFTSAAGTTISNDGLEPGSTYHYLINVPPGNGRRPYQATGSFVTLRETTTVKVVWERVRVIDDTDDLSTGEIQFWFWANYGQAGGKFSQYYNGDADSGHTYEINKTVTIENAPNVLTLAASGSDNDCTFVGEISDNDHPLDGPVDNDCSDGNVARGEFQLTTHDGTVPFTLNTSGGPLKFTIFGRFEITRSSERTGTTSSGLGTNASPPIKLGKVKLPPANPSAPPVSICDSARSARGRNSPAAPGLEAQCRAVYAAKGEAIAKTDPVVAAARVAESDANYRAGFDIATAIFGDPALGAQGNTATGPGSLGIRNALSPAGQRGFNASVALHLSRNYKH